MRPLTDTTPKPLLTVNGVPLLSYHIRALADSGYGNAIINTAWLEDQIISYYSLSSSNSTSEVAEILNNFEITFSREGSDFGYALETAGGIIRTLSRLERCFWAIAGDIYVPGFDFHPSHMVKFENSPYLAHLFLVPNPAHNPRGDFGISANGAALNLNKDSKEEKFTYSSIGLYKKTFFEPPINTIAVGNVEGVNVALAPLLRTAMDLGLVSAELLLSPWTDVGTPSRLHQLNTVD
jgi:MurNAc alpha-1-phosphate uridylyltransferase